MTQGERGPSGDGVGEGAVLTDTVGHEDAKHQDRADVGVLEIFRWIYRFFYSKTVGLVLILLLAFYAVIGSLVVQAAPGTFSDPAAKQAFLAQVGPNYGAFAGILNGLGFFHAYTSIGFYIVVTMLGLSVAACTTHRIPELVRRSKQPRVHVAKRFFDRARYRATVVAPASTEVSLQTAEDVLRENRFRVLPDPRDPHSVYGDRYSWSGIGTVLAHTAFIIILAAFVISSTWGIDDLKSVPVGGSVEVGHGSDLVLTAHSFADSYTEDGRPADYVSELEISEGGEVVATQEVRVNSPLSYGGFRFHQQSFGIAADFLIRDMDGSDLFEGAIPLQWTSADGLNAVGRIEIPEKNLEVIVATAASGQPNSSILVGMAAVELYALDTEQPIAATQLTQGDSELVGSYEVTFERENQFTGILVRKDPGAIWMWIGSIMLVVGMCITFMFQYRRIWVRVEPGSETGGGTAVRFGGISRLDASYQRMFERIVESVADDLAATTDIEMGPNGPDSEDEEV
ncbi:cytochrome c biogenesis protein ResB [Actinomyces minihominis]|uniref:cytochrome c biogenesis protein ResB n=1 Tax=Actinomyces minihominis TaxID=2002838 RepID=UPI000C08C33A|nr:cytochrome c biogenesis protein ResB [Actinomyces minihominis]